MKYLVFFLLTIQSLYSQSYFGSREDVVKHLEGEWKLDYTSWMGIPSDLRDSSFSVKFENSPTQLICKTFNKGILIESKNIEIEYVTNDGFPGPWRLKGLPYFLANYSAILENAIGEYALSETKMVLFQMAFDGTDFSMTKIQTTKTNEISFKEKLLVFPNPVIEDKVCFERTKSNCYKFNLINIAGKVVYKSYLKENENCVELPELIIGLYIFQLIDDKNNEILTKLIVK